MKFAKIVDNIVKQVQPNFEEGYSQVPDDVVPGQIKGNDGSFKNPPKKETEIDFCRLKILQEYDSAMRILQNGYSDEEVKTFTPKQDAIREYSAGRRTAAPEENAALVGIAALSAENRTMLEGLAGSTDDLVIAAKLDNMAAASATFKAYLGTIERLRDEHLAQLVDGQDNTLVINNLIQAYAALNDQP